MTEYDNRNRGVLFKNDRKTSDKHPDYKGTANMDGRDYYVSAWVRDGKKGKFMSMSYEAKDAQPEGHPDRFQQQVPVNRQRPSGIPERPRQVREDELADDIPF